LIKYLAVYHILQSGQLEIRLSVQLVRWQCLMVVMAV